MNEEEPQSKIPDFANREGEAAWFDTHDIGDYLDEFTVIDRKDVQVRLHADEEIAPSFLEEDHLTSGQQEIIDLMRKSPE